MIAKQINASSTKGTILYAGEKKDAEVIFQHEVFGSPKSVATQFKHVQQLNTRTQEKNKTFHSTIALHRNDKNKLSKEQEKQLIQDYAKALNLDKNQYIAYKHNDNKNHPHFHFIANRINEETKKAVNLGWYRVKHMEFCETQEKKYNLTVAARKDISKSYEPQKSYEPKNSQLEKIRPIVQKNIKQSKDIQDFIKRMEKDNIQTNLKGTGIAFFTDDKVKINGSKLGREFSLKGIEKQIEEQNSKKIQETKVEKPKEIEKNPYLEMEKEFKISKAASIKGETPKELTDDERIEILIERTKEREIQKEKNYKKRLSAAREAVVKQQKTEPPKELTAKEHEIRFKEVQKEIDKEKTAPKKVETEKETIQKAEPFKEPLSKTISENKAIQQQKTQEQQKVQKPSEKDIIEKAKDFHLKNIKYPNRRANISLFLGKQPNPLRIAFEKETGIHLSDEQIKKVHQEVKLFKGNDLGIS